LKNQETDKKSRAAIAVIKSRRDSGEEIQRSVSVVLLAVKYEIQVRVLYSERIPCVLQLLGVSHPNGQQEKKDARAERRGLLL